MGLAPWVEQLCSSARSLAGAGQCCPGPPPQGGWGWGREGVRGPAFQALVHSLKTGSRDLQGPVACMLMILVLLQPHESLQTQG